MDSVMDSISEQLIQAFRMGIAAVKPEVAIRKFVTLTVDGCRLADLVCSTADLRILTVGKAAVPMAIALTDILADRIRQGLVISPEQASGFEHWPMVQGNHPWPGIGSMEAGSAVRELVKDCTADTTLLVGVSGGATSLLVDPPPEISLPTLRSIYQTLLASGADIQEMNAVRSRLDRLKGGGLVELALPGKVVGLILSDVVGDSISVIGSGLTDHPTAHNTLIGSNQQACAAVAQHLQSLGYQTQIVTTHLQGLAKLKGAEIARSIQNAPPGTALIYGGETTVTLPVNCPGQGGRNQELVLAAAIELHKYSTPAWIGSIGTDGIDGASPAAGAICQTQTVAMAQGMNAQEYLDQHDSYSFFQPLGLSIMTGATGTNVADISIALRL
jgi:glycerate 2-kinase